MSVLIWCEQPQVPLWQQRAPCGLNTDISLYTVKQGFSTCLPMGRWSICGSPKPLWASFSLLPLPEQKHTLLRFRYGNGLRFSDMGTKCLKTELRCLVPACCQETLNSFPGLHLVAFHQNTESLMAFLPLFLLISGTPSKSCSQSLKTL